MSGRKQLKELILALFGGCGELSSTLHCERISLWLISCLELTVVNASSDPACTRWLIVEAGEEGGLLGRVV